MSDRLLVLVRHGQSDWNLKNLFTGWRDVDLDRQGRGGSARSRPQAEGARAQIRRRLHLGAQARPAHARPDAGGNGPDRHSGHQGPGAERARLWRPRPASTKTTPARNGARSRCTSGAAPTTCAPPGGESLRIRWPACCLITCTEILPRVLRGERVLVAAHGNSLRALVMVLERLSPEEILKRESAPACRSSTGSTPTRR